jgi:hypothetical protein
MRGTAIIVQRSGICCSYNSLLTRFRKYSKNIDFDAYKAYRDARNRPPPTPPASNNVLRHSVIDEVLESSSNGPANNETGGILPTPANASEPAAPYPTSFAHIVELITSGQPIPGMKEIPPTVLEGQGTQASKPRRKKPWEQDEIGTST